MQRLFLAGLLSLAVQSSSQAGPAVEYPLYGFKIGTLDRPLPEENIQVMHMFLPASQGFAPNVNVMIQVYADSLESYIKLSKGQFEQLALVVVDEKAVGTDEWRCEYKGSMQGKQLHFYARGLAKNGRMYLVTATALEEQWTEVSGELRKNVDSFSLR